MTPRHKTILAIAGTFCCLALAFFLASHWAVGHTLQGIRDEAVRQAVGQRLLAWFAVLILLIGGGFGLLVAALHRSMLRGAAVERRRAQEEVDRTQGGLGLGLTLVERLIQMHGGTVTAASAGLGRGSEFTVRLPLLAGAIADDGPQMPAEQLTLNFRQGRAGAKPRTCKVLVVDDNADMARTTGELLEVWGYNVRVAFDGAAAIELAGAWQPEAILLDIGLPGMNGYEVARCLRQAPALASTLLVALTGYSQEEDRQAALEAGFDHFMTKPVKLAELRHILEGATIPSGQIGEACAEECEPARR